eukprot:jgi/Chrpa1/28023/Chrysochromulina_OHIO_Genome00013654-RA
MPFTAASAADAVGGPWPASSSEAPEAAASASSRASAASLSAFERMSSEPRAGSTCLLRTSSLAGW